MRKYAAILLYGVLGLTQTEPALAMGEKYAEQGNRLGRAIEQHLIDKKICSNDAQRCVKKLTMYGGHGNRINFSIYAPDRQALAAMFSFLVQHGMEVTGGIPISITVYPKTRAAYGNIFFSPPEQMTMEINR